MKDNRAGSQGTISVPEPLFDFSWLQIVQADTNMMQWWTHGGCSSPIICTLVFWNNLYSELLSVSPDVDIIMLEDGAEHIVTECKLKNTKSCTFGGRGPIFGCFEDTCPFSSLSSSLPLVRVTSWNTASTKGA